MIAGGTVNLDAKIAEIPAGNVTGAELLKHDADTQAAQFTQDGKMQAAGFDHQWDMMLGQQIGQGVGDLFKLGGWVLATYLQQSSMEAINDRRMLASERISEFQTNLGMEFAKLQGAAHERLYGPNGYAREVEQIKANTNLAALDKTLEHKERLAALRSVDDAFSMSRNDYAYGNPFAA